MPLFPFRGEQVLPGDMSLDPEGAYSYPGYSVYSPYDSRDGTTAVPPSDFYFMYFANYVNTLMTADEFGECNFFIIAAAGTSATVRFSQAYDAGSTYAGFWTWSTPTTIDVGPGRTYVMPLDPALRNGASLLDGPPLLRVEVLSGTLVLDTIELQLEPPSGLMIPTGGWVWSDYIDAAPFIAQPLRHAEGLWDVTAYGSSGNGISPILSHLNGAYHDALAGSGTVDNAAATGMELDPLTDTITGTLSASVSSEFTFWWDSLPPSGYGAIMRKRMGIVICYWTEYPTNFHVLRPGIAAYVTPVDAFYEYWWEQALSGFELHPTDLWDTVGWRVSVDEAISYDAISGTEPADILARTSFTLGTGAPATWPGDGVDASLSFPMPSPGTAPSPAPTWTDIGTGYTANARLATPPAAGTDLVFIANGTLGDLTSYPFGAGASPGILTHAGAELTIATVLQPPRVRFKQAIWEPSSEAYIPPFEEPIPAGYFLGPNPNLAGLGDGVDVNFA